MTIAIAKKFNVILLGILLSIPSISSATSSTTKKAIYTKTAPAPIGAFSQAIQVKNTTYISGQIPIDVKTGELIKGDFKAQFRQAILNLSEITKAAGGSLNNIVKVTVYVTDLNNFTSVNQVMAEYFREPYPARAVIEIKGLPKYANVEIEAVMEKEVGI